MSSSQPNGRNEEEQSSSCCHPLHCRCGQKRIPQRIIIAILLHFLLQSNYNTRVVLNVAIVEMVPHPKENFRPACLEYGTPHATNKSGTFDWPRRTQSLVLYAFYIGYTLTQIPGGWYADKFGARYVMATCVFVSIVSTALFPVLTSTWDYYAAVVLRFLLGAAHGPSIPAVCSMVSTWIPAHERAVWGGIAYGGPNLGIIMGNTISGVLIQYFDAWPVAFYAWAIYAAVYFLFYMIYVFSFPDTHPYISEDEADFIRQANSGNKFVVRRSLHTPWKKILRNVPIWANVAAHFGHNYVYFTLITYLPTYMREILQFDVASDGYFAAIPFLALWLTSIVLSFTAPVFLRCMKQHTFDKYFGAGTNMGSAALVLGAVYVGCDRYLSISLFVLSMVVKAFYYVTLPVNINALSRNYGGIIFGMSNAVSSISGILGNFIIGVLTKDKQLAGWRMASWVSFGVTAVTTVIYFAFSAADRQEFDYEEGEERTDNSN